MLFMVTWRARSLSSGWITQKATVAAQSAEAAKDQIDRSLGRLYKVGSWFVDWAIVSATQVG